MITILLIILWCLTGLAASVRMFQTARLMWNKRFKEDLWESEHNSPLKILIAFIPFTMFGGLVALVAVEIVLSFCNQEKCWWFTMPKNI